MKEYFKINHIDVGFTNHPTKDSGFNKGALTNEVIVRKGKLRINLLTPALEITDEIHNGLLDDAYYDNQRKIDYLRMVTYTDIAVPDGAYDRQIKCPLKKMPTGFETYNFPEQVKFHGIIDVQKGFVHIKGYLKSEYGENKNTIPIDIVKAFDPKPLLPERIKYTLETAQGVNPHEVYDLAIGKGQFEQFPAQISTFKNLEQLWIGGQARINFNQYPEAFYELKQLHTIQLYGSQINHLSEKIEQLKHLEELTIRSGRLTILPEGICKLHKLTTLNVRYNQLTHLPENIATLTNLKELDIVGNKFKSLPSSLNQIFRVEVDRKHKKLYTDTSYKSKNIEPVDESFFDLTHHPEEKQKLEQLIESNPRLKEFKDLIVDYSTMATYLVLEKELEEIPLGASKVGGVPDLPKGWKHPANKNGLYYLFHAQINCKEIAPFQKYLPRKGMLYFFVSDEESVQKAFVLYNPENEDLSRIKYGKNIKFSDSDMDNFYRTGVAVSFKNAISLPELYNVHNHGEERFPKYKSYWENVDDDEMYDKLEYLSEAIYELGNKLEAPIGMKNQFTQRATHGVNTSVFTQHESPQEWSAAKYGGEPTDWLVLLNMENIGEFSFWDAGTLTYCVHKQDLAISEFSTINATIESS